MSPACRQPPRRMNSRNGSTTASFSVFGPCAREPRLVDRQRHQQPRQHEQRGDPEHARPRQVVGEDQRQRAGDEARDPVGVDVNGVAEPELDVGQDLAPEGVEHDVLAGREQRHRRGEVGDGPDVEARVEVPEQRDRGEQQQLRREHPPAPAPQQRQPVAVHQRRPQELPGVGELDQREEADRLQVHGFRAQPRRQQVDEDVERQAGGEAGEDADQHPPVEERVAPGLGLRRGRRRSAGIGHAGL